MLAVFLHGKPIFRHGIRRVPSLILTHALITQLFRDHRVAVEGFLCNRIHCTETAMDLSQETYLRLMRKGSVQHGENLAGYLFRTAERLAVDYLRQNQFNKSPLLPLDEEMPCRKPQPDELASLSEQCAILLEAIAALPNVCRKVFLLRKLDEMSYGDIALRLDISEKTVQRHLVKAMLHCHKRMENHPARRR